MEQTTYHSYLSSNTIIILFSCGSNSPHTYFYRKSNTAEISTDKILSKIAIKVNVIPPLPIEKTSESTQYNENDTAWPRGKG